MANYPPLSNTHRKSGSDRRRTGVLCHRERFVWWVNGEMPEGDCQVHVGLQHQHHSGFYSDAQWPTMNLRPASEKRGTTGTLCVTKQEEHPEAVLSNLLHTEAKRLWSVRRWRVLSRMRLSSSRGSLEFPLSLFTSLAQPRELSLEESGKHQRGMTGISAFHSPPPVLSRPPPLLTLDAFAQPDSWVFSCFWTQPNNNKLS